MLTVVHTYIRTFLRDGRVHRIYRDRKKKHDLGQINVHVCMYTHDITSHVRTMCLHDITSHVRTMCLHDVCAFQNTVAGK